MPDTNSPDLISATSSTQSQKLLSTVPTDIRPGVLGAGLYLVATPIGNLRDITLRALDILSSADLVLVEDTRRARILLSAYGIKAPLSAYHDHNVAKKLPGVIKNILAGKSVALISDAGTPLVNDPGFKLVRACIDEELPVFAIPGASAVLAGLVSSGLPPDKFMFAGFLPPKSAARQTALRQAQDVPASLIYFETAKRIEACLADIQAIFGDRQISIARELTKKYEEILRGTASELLEMARETPLRGEIVLIIAPPDAPKQWDENKIRAALHPLIKTEGVKRAAAQIAIQSGHKKRDVYALALQLKESPPAKK
ncbi:MAG: 16S rRNA (cytidine(1402)-2'-O)-methyltransferase [Robiginitomaculum sp.]|nr:16S rRNA (cytidine(1402)-2'-O)-methyltransferase [Robiginitomaculum sp.]